MTNQTRTFPRTRSLLLSAKGRPLADKNTGLARESLSLPPMRGIARCETARAGPLFRAAGPLIRSRRGARDAWQSVRSAGLASAAHDVAHAAGQLAPSANAPRAGLRRPVRADPGGRVRRNRPGPVARRTQPYQPGTRLRREHVPAAAGAGPRATRAFRQPARH